MILSTLKSCGLFFKIEVWEIERSMNFLQPPTTFNYIVTLENVNKFFSEFNKFSKYNVASMKMSKETRNLSF